MGTSRTDGLARALGQIYSSQSCAISDNSGSRVSVQCNAELSASTPYNLLTSKQNSAAVPDIQFALSSCGCIHNTNLNHNRKRSRQWCIVMILPVYTTQFKSDNVKRFKKAEAAITKEQSGHIRLGCVYCICISFSNDTLSTILDDARCGWTR